MSASGDDHDEGPTMVFAHCVNCLRNHHRVVIVQARYVNDDEGDVTIAEWNAGNRSTSPCAMCGEQRPSAFRDEDTFFVFTMNYEYGAKEAEDLRDDLSV
jgi:hypothetical protein